MAKVTVTFQEPTDEYEASNQRMMKFKLEQLKTELNTSYQRTIENDTQSFQCELWLERERYLVYLVIKNVLKERERGVMLKNIVKEFQSVNVREDKENNGNTI